MAGEIDYRALVRAIGQKTGEKQAELAERFGVSQPTISRWLAGGAPELEHAKVIERIARNLKVLGRSGASDVMSVPIVGYVGAGGTISFSEGQGPFGEADMPPKKASSSLVAVVVKGDSMSGSLEDGWTVYYDNRREEPTESDHGKMCVVGLTDGRVLVKRLYPGRKARHFDLHSANGSPLLDQAVEWAARVVWIQPV